MGTLETFVRIFSAVRWHLFLIGTIFVALKARILDMFSDHDPFLEYIKREFNYCVQKLFCIRDH